MQDTFTGNGFVFKKEAINMKQIYLFIHFNPVRQVLQKSTQRRKEKWEKMLMRCLMAPCAKIPQTSGHRMFHIPDRLLVVMEMSEMNKSEIEKNQKKKINKKSTHEIK